MDQEVEVCTMTLSLITRREGLSMDHGNDNEKRGLLLFTGTQVPSGNVSTFDLRIGVWGRNKFSPVGCNSIFEFVPKIIIF